MTKKTLAFAVAYGLVWVSLPASADPVPKAPVLCMQGKPCEQPATAPPSVTAPPPASDTSTTVSDRAVKWHPGHYVYLPGCPFITTATCYKQTTAFIDTIQSDANVKGVMIEIMWGQLEGNTPGDYAAGFAAVDSLLAYMASHGQKKLILRAMYVVYGNWNPSDVTGNFPKYILPPANNGSCSGSCPYRVTEQPASSAFVANVWEAATMDRWIALVQAYGARYDTNVALETWSDGAESDFAWSPNPPSWSTSAYNTQLKRLLDVERRAFPHTNIWHVSNWSYTTDTMKDLVDYYTRSDIYASFGAHDWMPQGATWADQFYAGAGVQGGANFGTTDHRLEVPYFAFMDEPELCDGRTSKPNADALHNWTPQEFYDYGQKTGNATTNNKPLLPTHQLWMAHSGYIASCVAVGGISNQTWNGCTTGGTCGSTGSFRDFIDQGTHPTRSACPTLYPGCNTH